MRWLHFILSHSIFISFCALALCFQTILLLHFTAEAPLYYFIFFATLSSYNFYWLISKYSFSRIKPLQNFLIKNLSYTFIFLLAGLGMAVSIYFMPYAYGYVLIAIALTFLYSLPLWPIKMSGWVRKAGFLKTGLLAFTWAYVTVIIPAIPVLSLEFWPVITLFVARFLFMLMLCLIFDMRDMTVDKIHGLHSLATDLSRRNLNKLMLIAFLLYVGAGFFLRMYFKDNAQVFAFAVTALMIWGVYRMSLKKHGYFFYYFLVDGLMLLSAGATFIATKF